LEAHLLNGFVFSTPRYFVMGRPVVRSAPAHLILDPTHVFPATQADCWHVWLLAGDVGKAWGVLPWELPWMSFERGNVLRFRRLHSMRRLTKDHL
jgi:hypothetical protein